MKFAEKCKHFSINKIEHLCFLVCTIFQLLAHKHRIIDWCYIWNWFTMKLWACFMIYAKYRVGIMNILRLRCWGCALKLVDKQHLILSKIHSYWSVPARHRSLWFGRNCSDLSWNCQGSWQILSYYLQKAYQSGEILCSCHFREGFPKISFLLCPIYMYDSDSPFLCTHCLRFWISVTWESKASQQSLECKYTVVSHGFNSELPLRYYFTMLIIETFTIQIPNIENQFAVRATLDYEPSIK